MRPLSNSRLLNIWQAMGLTFWVPLEHHLEQRSGVEVEQSPTGPLPGSLSISVDSPPPSVRIDHPLQPAERVETAHEAYGSSSHDSSELIHFNVESSPKELPRVAAQALDPREGGSSKTVAAVWGVVASRKLAFWADFGDPAAPGLSSAESELLWRIMMAIGVARSDVTQSQIIRWPLVAVGAGWRPELGDASDMLLAFFGRSFKPPSPILRVLIFGDSLVGFPVLKPLISLDVWSESGLEDLDVDQGPVAAVRLPSLKSMLNDGRHKAQAWNLLKKI